MRAALAVTTALFITLAACGRSALKLQAHSAGGNNDYHADAGTSAVGGAKSGTGGQAGRATGGAGGYAIGSGGVIGSGGARATGGMTSGMIGSGGATRVGGAVGSGGTTTSATGGSPRTGGTIASGGRSGSGGVMAGGGRSGSGGSGGSVGGSTRTGGSVGSGGTVVSGGTLGRGGSAAGGAVSHGGTTGRGGTSGTGGTCGNGVLNQPVEQCDLGAENQDSPAFWVTQGGLGFAAVPLARDASAKDFYSYSSASAHTGLEAAGTSRIFLYLEKATHALSLVVFSGIDQDSAGVEQPTSHVQVLFSGLPDNASVEVSDDSDELLMTSATTATGFWKFTNNSDGGALSGLPFPGTWEFTVAPSFIDGISTWTWVQSDGSLVNLDLGQPLSIKASSLPSLCRPNCTIPGCGDGILDAGEICDEGPLPPDGAPGCHCMSFE